MPEIKDEKRIPRDGTLVVTRTRDGGKTFETLADGLPQQHAYDIVYRHALALDETGDRLAFGSTTGGLWVSENQGDSWTSIAQICRRSTPCGSPDMATTDDSRRIALALDGTSEAAHFDRAALRVARIYATIAADGRDRQPQVYCRRTGAEVH